MTSSKQIEANRNNASRSTGPRTATGKDRSRRNAVRHGLTAETVIATLEDAEDYKAFEAAVTTDFNPETAVERELVLRLASLLWRLRRAASIETGMFETFAAVVDQGDKIAEQSSTIYSDGKTHVELFIDQLTKRHRTIDCRYSDLDESSSIDTGMDTISRLANRFLKLATAETGAFERLGRYETALWRQVCQTAFMLEFLRRQSLDTKLLPRSSHPDSKNPFSLPRFRRR